MQQAKVTHVHAAIGQDRREEPAEKLHDVEGGGAEACTARVTRGDGDGAVGARDETTVGEGAPEDIGGEVVEGRGAVRLRLTVDVPGGVPDLWGEVLSQSSFGPLLLPQGAIDGREGLHRDKAVGSGGAPRVTVFGETATWDDGMHMRGVLELSAPGMEDTGKTRKLGPDAPRVLGEPFKGFGRGVEQGVVREALMRADEETPRLRNGAGEEEMRPGPRCLQMVGEPRLGCLLLALGTVAVATGVMDAVCFPTAGARREARPIMAAAAVWDGAESLAVRGGEDGRARQIFWRKGGADSAQGGHGRRPCMRALRRA